MSIGSPPRTWGRSLWESALVPVEQVHPHARGDDEDGDWETYRQTGSPPRTWGRFVRDLPPFESFRFTPTHVGTIGYGKWRPVTTEVHPHARGDD